MKVLESKRRPKNGKELRSNYEDIFHELLTSLQDISFKENLIMTPAASHLTHQGLKAICKNAGKQNKSIATIIHKKISLNFKRSLGRVPTFFLTLGYDKKASRKESTQYSGVHIHAIILLTPKELDNRTQEGKKARNAFKLTPREKKENKFKFQEVRFSTSSELEFYRTNYSSTQRLQMQSRYLAKNARQSDYYDNLNQIQQRNQKPFASSQDLKARFKNNNNAINPQTAPTSNVLQETTPTPSQPSELTPLTRQQLIELEIAKLENDCKSQKRQAPTKQVLQTMAEINVTSRENPNDESLTPKTYGTQWGGYS